MLYNDYTFYSIIDPASANQIHAEIKEAVTKDLESVNGGETRPFIDHRAVNRCWHEIWRWINVPSVGALLLKYGIVGDIMELQYLQHPLHSPRQKADHLLTLAAQGGPYGYHVLYMCIRDDDENPMGHASAVDALVEAGM